MAGSRFQGDDSNGMYKDERDTLKEAFGRSARTQFTKDAQDDPEASVAGSEGCTDIDGTPMSVASSPCRSEDNLSGRTDGEGTQGLITISYSPLQNSSGGCATVGHSVTPTKEDKVKLLDKCTTLSSSLTGAPSLKAFDTCKTSAGLPNSQLGCDGSEGYRGGHD